MNFIGCFQLPEIELFIGYMNLLKTNQSLNKGETFYVDYKINKNATTIGVFSSFFVSFSQKYASIKTIFNV